MLIGASAMAAPLYPEMSASRKNLAHDVVEDRNNPGLINLITTLTFQTSLILLVYKWRIIFCALDPRTCSNPNVTPPTNALHVSNTYDPAFETSANILAAADMITSNLSAQNVDALLNAVGLSPTQENLSIVREMILRQNPFEFPVSDIVKAFAETQPYQGISQHNLKSGTDRTLNPSHLLLPFNPISPYFQWPVMYQELLHRPPSFFV